MFFSFFYFQTVIKKLVEKYNIWASCFNYCKLFTKIVYNTTELPVFKKFLLLKIMFRSMKDNGWWFSTKVWEHHNQDGAKAVKVDFYKKSLIGFVAVDRRWQVTNNARAAVWWKSRARNSCFGIVSERG